MPPRLSDDQKEKMISLYNSGHKVVEIADHFGVSRQTVYNVLHKNNINVTRRSSIKEYYDTLIAKNLDKILEYYIVDEKSPREIAKSLNMPCNTVIRALRAHAPIRGNARKAAKAVERYNKIAKELLNNEKLTYGDAAKMFGVSYQTVIRAARYAGIRRHSYPR